MSDTRLFALMKADRVRVSRETLGGVMSDTRLFPLMKADRVRVSRETQEN